MSLYKNLIIEATQCPPGDAKEIEEVMRLTYRTLDHLDRRAFVREAKFSYEAVKIMRDTRGVGVLFQAKAPYDTWTLFIEHEPTNKPTMLLEELMKAGWSTEGERQPLMQVTPKHRIYLGVRGTGPFGRWTDAEAKKSMASARKVLRRFGFEKVPKHKLTHAETM